jgi:hypothetical protein
MGGERRGEGRKRGGNARSDPGTCVHTNVASSLDVVGSPTVYPRRILLKEDGREQGGTGPKEKRQGGRET